EVGRRKQAGSRSGGGAVAIAGREVGGPPATARYTSTGGGSRANRRGKRLAKPAHLADASTSRSGRFSSKASTVPERSLSGRAAASPSKGRSCDTVFFGQAFPQIRQWLYNSPSRCKNYHPAASCRSRQVSNSSTSMR